MIVPDRSIAAALGVLLVASVTPHVAQAQLAPNSLAPSIAPYAPKSPRTAPRSRLGGGPGLAAPATQAPLPAEATDWGGAGYDYRLGAGDKLRITVFGEEGLTGEFFVAGNGHISFPLIGEIPAAGKTVVDVQDEIAAALRDGYLKDPRVSAEVLIFRPYYILGEVTKPGEYPYSNGITVTNAVATAGGFTYRANEKYIYVKKASEETEHKVRLTDGILLEPGETVRIIERYF